jgi:hypothetical protein
VLFLTQCGVTLLRLFGVSRGHLTLDRDSKRSDLTNDQVLVCGLDHCGGEMLELIDLEPRSIWVSKSVIRRKLPPVIRMMAATTSGAGAFANEPEARAVQSSSRRVCTVALIAIWRSVSETYPLSPDERWGAERSLARSVSTPNTSEIVRQIILKTTPIAQRG